MTRAGKKKKKFFKRKQRSLHDLLACTPGWDAFHSPWFLQSITDFFSHRIISYLCSTSASSSSSRKMFSCLNRLLSLICPASPLSLPSRRYGGGSSADVPLRAAAHCLRLACAVRWARRASVRAAGQQLEGLHCGLVWYLQWEPARWLPVSPKRCPNTPTSTFLWKAGLRVTSVCNVSEMITWWKGFFIGHVHQMYRNTY